MDAPEKRKKRIAAGLWTILLLAALAGAPAGSGPASCWAGDYPDPPLAPPESPVPLRGGALVRTRGCLECHRLGEQGAQAGVDLFGIRPHLDAETIGRLLRDPQGVHAWTAMPRPDLTRAETLIIADFLSRLP